MKMMKSCSQVFLAGSLGGSLVGGLKVSKKVLVGEQTEKQGTGAVDQRSYGASDDDVEWAQEEAKRIISKIEGEYEKDEETGKFLKQEHSLDRIFHARQGWNPNDTDKGACKPRAGGLRTYRLWVGHSRFLLSCLTIFKILIRSVEQLIF